MGRMALLLIISCFVFVSCKKDEAPRSNAKSIVKFSVDTISGTIDENAHTVKLVLPYALDLTAVRPKIVISPGATIWPTSAATVDLSSPFTYKVTAADGSEQVYTVMATKRIANSIESFTVSSGETVNAIVNDTTHTITLKGIFLYNNWAVAKPVIKVSSGATVSPASEEEVNLFLSPKYRVTGPDGKVQEYTVKVLNTDNTISWMVTSLPNVSYFAAGVTYEQVRTAAIDKGLFLPEDVKDITTHNVGIFYATKSDDLSNITFTNVQVPEGATVVPSFDLPQDFNKDVVYTITSMSGDQNKMTVRAIRQNFITYASGATSMISSFIGVDEIGFAYRIATSAPAIDKIVVVGSDNKEYAATIESDIADDRSVHKVRLKSDTVLPLGHYHLKILFKDGTSLVDITDYNKVE
jgi:hypothetical protein